jgi:uncharacterized protein (TIGR02246 family)
MVQGTPKLFSKDAVEGNKGKPRMIAMMMADATDATGYDVEEAAIREVIDAITRAVRARDVEAMLAECTPDIVTFDMLPPLKHQGADALRRLWAATLESFTPPLDYDVHQLDITVDDNVAFARSLNRFAGTTNYGERVINWLCVTLGSRKLDGRWKLAHQHVSVPFDLETGQALLELEPEGFLNNIAGERRYNPT